MQQNKNLSVFRSALYMTTSTVFHNEELILIVDPNWLPEEVRRIRQFVDDIKKNQAIYLLFTHSDYDHIIGYQAFPEAKVIASEAFVQQTNKASIIDQILKFDDEYYIQRDYEIVYPSVDFVIKNDKEQLRIGETTLTFYLASGHNIDGIFTIIEPDGIWVAGDYLCDVEFPYIYHSSIEYEATLAKVDAILKNHDIQFLIPGHGHVTTSKTEILNRKKDALAYIHQLRTCLQNNQIFDVHELWKRYQFPRIMTQFHDANVALIKKELEQLCETKKT